MEKTNTDKKKDAANEAELNSFSEYIINKVKDGNKLSSSEWFEAFNKPETLIMSYGKDKKDADSNLAIKFINDLGKQI
ncbi:hypothetical protein [Fenollaria massiliensis]|uniref:hypothetical protein n=1 Tax=Fenollaria massiliensis TaxID=938288 RepID=UPI00037D5071|nr:hypothetical protein [Fenollaria massiliensis]